MSAKLFATPAESREAAELGTWVFLATELMFFGPLLFAYTYGRIHYPETFAAASRETWVSLGTLNTALLLTSSLTMALAVRAAREGRRRGHLLGFTAALGLAFLVVKGTEYALEWRAGHTVTSGLFYFLYYALTGVHALHLALGIGLVLWLARRGHATEVEMGGLYWHFVDMVWIFLFPLVYLLERYR